MKSWLVRICTSSALLACTLASAASSLETVAERSGFQRTGRYQEVIQLCGEFARAFPRAVRCLEFGRTPEGRPMQVLVVSQSGALSPAAAHKRGLPVLLVQGGIHAGEIDGKDAGFLALRELLRGEVAKGALKAQVLLFVPVFNVDGHERFKAWNRPNQRGPEEMGWRTTAQNYNLNRDYAKADTPEMRAMLALVQQWDPVLTVDLHVTDGAKFEHDISIQIEPLYAGDEALRVIGKQFSAALLGHLSDTGSLPLAFYPSFVETDNPASGFIDGVAPPRFSTGYFWLRNRFSMLVETHSWKDYPTRVRSTRNTVIGTVEQVAQHGKQWLAQAHAADRRTLSLEGAQVALDYAATDQVRTIDFRGYAYTRTPSEVSGGLMTHYDENTPQIWKVPLRDQVQPGVSVAAPLGGYVVPAAHALWVSERLRVHGIGFERIAHGMDDVAAEVFRAQSSATSAGSVEGHQRLTVTGQWAQSTHSITAGSLYVPIQQPLARLVMALLEPNAPDSFLAWGEFNNAFEQKEYMEDYVAEAVAREMLADDPALAAAFGSRLASDPAFASDPQARLQFFHQRHSAWDDRLGLYPVVRVAQRPGR
jgi:hypothetical protein